MFSHRVIFHGRRVCHAKKAGLRGLLLARCAPRSGRAGDPEAAAALVVGPERERLLSMVGLVMTGPTRPCRAEQARWTEGGHRRVTGRLVGDWSVTGLLPAWMRPLWPGGRRRMPGPIHNLVGLAPAAPAVARC